MKFALHTEVRWAVDLPQRRYRNAVKLYYQHLLGLRVFKAKTLLKYFGDSFFHDADVASIEVRPDEDDLVLRLFTLNDLEDINTYRCAKRSEERSVGQSIG